VASKNNSDAVNGWAHIYDVSNVGTTGPVLLKYFNTGGGTHTAMPSDDGTKLVVSQERSNGEVRIYDISAVDQPNDSDNPTLLKTLTRISVGIDAHSPHHSHIHGDLLFLSWYEAGLQVFNVSDWANPAWVGSFDTYPGTSTLFNGNWGVFPDLGLDKLLISDRNRGLLVVNATGTEPNADFDADFSVDGADFLAWQRHLGRTSATLAQGDGNRDRQTNRPDLGVWQSQFGMAGHHHGSTAVPEGATIGMLMPAALMFLKRRRQSAA
jgi:hypothetical protein